ncbi:MAG: hypothetical protein A4E28_00254 [Methanocella sp. PtaU1.Bin125]|nr:MAG: hypothetical protein A4E28_00254 [Methanocella sp. PtaU1.Bin125]
MIKRHAVIVLLMCLILSAALPSATAEFEFRRQIRAGDTLYNNEITILPLFRTIFHQDTMAATDTEAFALSALSPAGGDGIALAQTSAGSVAATQTGFFFVTLPFLWLPEYPGQMIGDRPDWAAATQPIRFAGLPPDTMMTFPEMHLITRPENDRGNVSEYTVNANNSIPFDQGNVMLVKNTTDENGRNVTTLERPPRPYMTLFASPEEIANKTIMERMWRNVHINYNLDRAYVGQTSFPTLIYPVRDTYKLMPFVPDNVSISAALNMTQTGKHIRRIFWPVGV